VEGPLARLQMGEPGGSTIAPTMPDPDVLLVGAGPTGLMLGGVLARLGVAVRLVERDPGPHEQARATGIQPRTLEIFDRLGIADGWLREGQVLRAFRSLSPEGRELRVERFADLDTPYPFSLNIQQRITERLLTEHLERYGGRVERGVELIALEQDADAATAVLRRGRQEETVRCRYVVGADGAHSRVADAIRVPVAGGDYASAFVVAEVEGTWPHPRDEATIIAGPTGICWGAVFGDGRFLIIADVPDDRAAGPPGRDDLQHLAATRAAQGVAIQTVHWSARFHLHCRLAERFRRGRVFLAGDAAHVCSLFGGQGLNMGVQDAANLGWKLALVVASMAPDRLLDSYEAERRRVAQSELAYTDSAHRSLFARDAAWPRSALAHEAAFVGSTDTAARRRLLAHAQLDVSYRESPIVASHGWLAPEDAAAGDWFARQGLSPDRHHLFTPAGLRAEDAVRRVRLPIAVHPTDEDTLHLVRPDGYIAFRSCPADLSTLAEYLDRTFG
jgi:2-polyprenyl-6-methoxyphenol hydroxylase-like FAD-dependent oxidoreductase